MAKPNFILTPRSQTVGYMIFSSLLVLILTTVVLSLILHHFQIRNNADIAPSRRVHDLMEQLKSAQDKRDALASELNDMRKKLLATDTKDASQGTLQQDPEVQKLYKMAGLTSVAGPGLIVELRNNTDKQLLSDPHADPNAGKLQAEDLLRLINELKAGGATAIAINNQRLVVTSEIVASGPMIAVNGNRLSQPVVVKVLGNPDLLQHTLQFPGGILEYLNFFNVKVSLHKKSTLALPAYKGPIN